MLLLPFTLFIGLSSSLVAVASSSSRPLLSRRILHERQEFVPPGWALHRRADPDAIVPVSIALRQSNVDRLDDFLLDIADPESPNYGKHWTASQVIDTFRPSRESVETVHSWLVNDGVHPHRIQLSKDGGHLKMDLTVAEAESLLAADFYVYQHKSGTERVGCHHGYHLPEHVSHHVDLVSPTVRFDEVMLQVHNSKRSGSIFDGSSTKDGGPVRSNSFVNLNSTHTDADHCDEQTSLSCIRKLYEFESTPVAPEKNTIAVVELGQQSYRPDDLDTFFRIYAPDSVGARPALMSMEGGKISPNQTSHIGEANMDFQLVMGLLGKRQNVWLYQSGDGYLQTILRHLDIEYCQAANKSEEVCKDQKPLASVVSVSYAGYETTSNSVTRDCTEYGKLSLMGMTFLYGSGDNGVESNSDGYCLSTNGTLSKHQGNFLVNSPSSCPYVTAVGSTELPAGRKPSVDRETATSGFGSGGGFSRAFTRPKFQDRAVNKWLSNYAPSYGPNVFNRTGRGIPDIAAIGSRILVVNDGQNQTSGGTSASAPIIAAMISGINDARIAVGKRPVGWINPALYSNLFADVYNDIIEGSNPGCGTPGFNATPGWDPVTGLGTPNYKKMKERFMLLP